MTRKTLLRPALQQQAPSSSGSDWASNAGLVEIQIEYRAVSELILDARNPRQHSERQINQLADSIREFGFVVPAATDGEGRVVIGHGRVLAAKKLKMARIPVIEIKHLSKAQLKALRIADNKLGQNSHWDERLLAESLLELKQLDGDFDLSITGFSLPEIDLAIQKLSAPVVEDIDGEDSRTGVPVCELGDREFAQGSGELSRDEFVRFLVSNCSLPGDAHSYLSKAPYTMFFRGHAEPHALRRRLRHENHEHVLLRIDPESGSACTDQLISPTSPPSGLRRPLL
jgi:hypothetical protein